MKTYLEPKMDVVVLFNDIITLSDGETIPLSDDFGDSLN